MIQSRAELGHAQAKLRIVVEALVVVVVVVVVVVEVGVQHFFGWVGVFDLMNLRIKSTQVVVETEVRVELGNRNAIKHKQELS